MNSLLLAIPVPVLIFLGGGVGALLRYLMVGLLKPASPAFPAGTLSVNILGCFAIGLLAARVLPDVSPLQPVPDSLHGRAWLLLAVGVLGGFTTFSSFAIECLDLLRQDRSGAMLAYVLLSNVLGILAAASAFALFSPRGGVTP